MPTHTTDHDPIDFTFEDDGDLVRHAPKAVPEDPVEKRLQRERDAAPFIAEAYRCASPSCPGFAYKASNMRHPCPPCVEVKYGSGKVKV